MLRRALIDTQIETRWQVIRIGAPPADRPSWLGERECSWPRERRRRGAVEQIERWLGRSAECQIVWFAASECARKPPTARLHFQRPATATPGQPRAVAHHTL